MAQATDYNLANQTGADFRAELNEILAASVSLNSGSSEPTTMYAHQLWVDTSSNVLKIRNAANNAWLTTGVSITASNTFDINAGTINGITSLSFSSGATVASILDEDNLSSDSATALATQQSIKAYVDSQVTAQDLDISDGSSTIAIDLDSETLSLLGGTGITSTASGNGVTFAIGQAVGTSDNVVFNQVTGALVGNASTATTLQTARTISGVSFNGSANITLDTDDIGEGSNKYFTAERVDDQVNTLLTAGANISLTYNDTAGTLTIANTNSADITSVVAGDGLTGGGTSGAVTLAVGVDDSSIEINSDALRVKASGITNAMLGGSIANNKLANSSVTINSNSLSLGGTLTLDTDDIGEGSSNLYYTDARANSAIDARVTNTFINNLSGVVADTATALATARTIALSGDVAGSVSFDGTSDVTISSTIQANSVALGTDTVGNYVATITGTANKVSVSGSGSETAGVTLSLPDDVQIADSLTVAGNLTVNGTLTSLDTTNLDIEDNLFQLNAGLTGSPVNDSGMLINRGNQNNGIFMWDESADKFTIGLTTADGTSTGNITLASLGTLVANLEGNVTGDVTGNVSGTAATVTGAAQTAITSLGTLTGLTTTGDINLGDNDKAIFGAGSDLQIYHDGSDSYIKEDGNGNLIIAADDFRVTNVAVSETMISADTDGVVKLYYDNATKLATTSTGIDVTGTVTFDGGTTSADLNFGDNDKAIFGAGSDLQIYSDGTHSRIYESGSGLLIIRAGNFNINNADGSQSYMTMSDGGAAIIYHAGNAKLATTSTGIDVTGTATMDGLTLGDNSTSEIPIYFNSSSTDFSVGANGNNFILAQTTGDLDTNQLLTVTSSGNLGLGTSSPLSKLNVKGTQGNWRVDPDSVSGEIQILSTTVANDGFRNFRLRSNESIFDTGGSERMRIDTSGNVGLGTSTPSSFNSRGRNLVVNSDGDTGITISSNASSSSTILFADAYAGTGGTAAYRGVIEYDHATDHMAISTAATERMRLDGSGNLGIGDASPDNKLHVNSGTSNVVAKFESTDSIAAIQFKDNNGEAEIGNVGNDIGFFPAGAEKMRLDASGNVGINQIPSATSAYMVALQVGEQANLYGHTNGTGAGSATYLSNNITHNGGFKYINADLGSQYTQASGVHLFSTFASGSAGAAATEVPVMQIDASGNVGIGTSNPGMILDVDGSSAANDIARFSGANSGGLIFRNATANEFIMHTATSDALIFGTSGNNERMRLDSSGNLGIGTASPTVPLTVNNSTDHSDIAIFHAGGGTPDRGLKISTFSNTNSNAGVELDAQHSTGAFKFSTGGSEKMRIDSSGNLLVGKTAANIATDGIELGTRIEATADGSYPLRVNRRNSDGTIIEIRKDGGSVGSISVTSSATAYNTSSDARLKDVTGEARGLEVINELNPVAYNWKADGNADEGLIAQEVMDIVPNAVSGSEEDMYQMDYSKLVVHLVKAVQELKAEIEELKGE